MKPIVIFCMILLLMVIFSSNTLAQNEYMANHSRLSFGYTLNNLHQNFGYGFMVTSPYFLHDRVAIRLAINQFFLEAIPEDKTEYEWIPYKVYRLGLIGVGSMNNQTIRLYGEGGIVYIIPNDDFSEESAVSGGYGLFGFEFFMKNDSSVCYFIELGTMGIGARAEKLPGNPLYANGFSTSVGLRIHL